MSITGRNRAALGIAAAITSWLFLTGLLHAQPYYFETSFIAQTTPAGEDVVTISAMENSPAFTPLLIDYSVGNGNANGTNIAAALDANFSLRAPAVPAPGWGPISPSGHLAVAKVFTPTPNPCIDFYVLWNCIPEAPASPGWHDWQNNWAPGGVQRPQTPLWSVATASGSPVMTMGIANGFPSTTQQLLRTDFLITAESIGGTVTLVAYGLTSVLGALTQPAWVNFRQYNPQIPVGSTVVGMAISNGTFDPSTGNTERIINEIMLVVLYPSGTYWVHSTTFDIRAAAFGPLDVSTAYPATPAVLGSNAFSGISIARNTGIYMNPTVYSHDVAISMAGASTTLAGSVHIFQPSGIQSTLPQPIFVGGFGGGPICHIPGSDPAGGGVAQQVFGATNPFGWYVAELTGPNPPHISSLNSSQQNGNFYYPYPAGAVANGPPMCHPGGFTKVGATRQGMLSIPISINGVPAFEFVEGVGNFPNASFPVQFGYTVPTNNHAPLPPSAPATLPKAGTAWPVTNVISGVAFLSEYGLYINGY